MNSNTNELVQLSDLIGLIYEGATDPTRWTTDILPAVAEYIGAPECILFTNTYTPQNGGYFFIHGIAQDHVDLYMNKYQDQDVWTIAAIEQNMLTEGKVFTGDDIIPRQQLLDSRFYKECLSRDQNMAQLLTCAIFGLNSGDVMPTALSFFRGLHQPDFNYDDRQRLQLILPHMSRALGVMQRLKTAELKVATSMAALNRLPTGVLLQDNSGMVSFANTSAMKILNQNDGLRLRKLVQSPELGKLTADNAEADHAINLAISATLNRDPYGIPHFSECIKVPRLSCNDTYDLQFSSLGEHTEFGDDIDTFSTIIFIIDKQEDLTIDLEELQKMYDLTPTEAKVAFELIRSDSAQEVAEKMGTSINTIRSQLKQIYAKLGVNTRARFVKLMMGLSKNPH